MAEEEDDEAAADIFGEGEGALDPLALLAGESCALALDPLLRHACAACMHALPAAPV